MAGVGRRFAIASKVRVAGNDVATAKGKIVIFDWDAATLRVPGADLHFPPYMEARDVPNRPAI
jgi:hypothetical protein